MNWINTIKSTTKNFFWELSHTLINYLLGLTIKGDLKINPNCYIFLTTKKSRLILNCNYLKYIDNELFESMECHKIVSHLNTSSIPTIKIDKIEITPRLENIFKVKKQHNFMPWSNKAYNTVNSIFRLENITSYFVTNCNLFIKTLVININNYKIQCYDVKVSKNGETMIINIGYFKISYLDIYIGKIKKFKLTYYIKEKRISSYIDKLVLVITNNFVKKNGIESLIKILESIPKSDEKANIKLLICNTKVIFEVHNSVNIISRNLNLERDRISVPYLNLKVWKKDILWANNITIPIDTLCPSIESLRLRLFKSTCDKLYKTLIIFKKRFYVKSKKKRRKEKYTVQKYEDKQIITNYFSKDDISQSLISSYHSILSNSDSSYEFEYEYYEGFLRPTSDIKLLITEAEISFEPYLGKFHFYNFSYSLLDNEVLIDTNRWLFHKDGIRMIDKINVKGNDRFSVSIGKNCLKIHPHKVYLNLDIETYSDCFGILIKNIGRICQIWNNTSSNQCNYIFEKVYFGSFYCLFSYSKSKFSIENLIDGNLIEILNIIGMSDLELLLDDVNILYPKDWTCISKIVLNKYLSSLKNKNLNNVLDKTPISNLKGITSIKTNFNYFTKKIKNTIS